MFMEKNYLNNLKEEFWQNLMPVFNDIFFSDPLVASSLNTQPIAETLKHHRRLKLHGSWQTRKCFTGTINYWVAHSNL